jgi:hypothetical protein
VSSAFSSSPLRWGESPPLISWVLAVFIFPVFLPFSSRDLIIADATTAAATRGSCVHTQRDVGEIQWRRVEDMKRMSKMLPRDPISRLTAAWSRPSRRSRGIPDAAVVLCRAAAQPRRLSPSARALTSRHRVSCHRPLLLTDASDCLTERDGGRAQIGRPPERQLGMAAEEDAEETRVPISPS